jgi:hypothetical protein
MGKQLVNFITCSCESSAPFFVIYKAGLEPKNHSRKCANGILYINSHIMSLLYCIFCFTGYYSIWITVWQLIMWDGIMFIKYHVCTSKSSNQNTLYMIQWSDQLNYTFYMSYFNLMFDWLILVFNATFSNISAISWQPVLVV